MEITLPTPALLFPAISLLLLAFTKFLGWLEIGNWIFGFSLILMMIALGISLREIQVSVVALDLHIQDMEQIIDGVPQKK